MATDCVCFIIKELVILKLLSSWVLFAQLLFCNEKGINRAAEWIQRIVFENSYIVIYKFTEIYNLKESEVTGCL